MLFSSPHPTLSLPPKDTLLPHFLLNTSSNSRKAEPLLFPPPKESSFSSNRPSASALSLDDIQRKAYQTAKSILDGAIDGKSTPFQKGDVVAIYSPNQHDYCAIILGIHLVGGIAALCNPSYKSTELAHQLRMTKSRCIITTGATKGGKPGDSPIEKARAAIELACSVKDDESVGDFAQLSEPPALFVFEEEEKDSWQKVCESIDVTPEVIKQVDEKSKLVQGDDAAVFCFSSGTSGLPKAVILTHSNLVANVIQATFLLHDRMNKPLVDGTEYRSDGRKGWYDGAEERESGRRKLPLNLFGVSLKEGTRERRKGYQRIDNRQEGQREFHIDVLPQFHCYGLLVNLVALHTCTPRIILPRFHLETYLQSVSDHGVTFGFVVPPIVLALAKHPLVDQYDVSTLWRVASGAASLPDEIARAVEQRLNIQCTDGYGMTEMSPIISMQTVNDIERAPNTVGTIAPNTQALILDPEGKEIGLNEPGELVLHGPQMMKGYFENNNANEKAFYIRSKDESIKWLRTGDVAKIDERGYITITDRLKDVIKAKGFQVSPAELEAVLFKDSRLADVAVTGIQDPKDGAEKPWAFLVAHDSVFKDVDDSEKESRKEEVGKSIVEKANSQMAGYKKIEGMTWIDGLPKSDAGKVLKKDLAALR